MGCELTCSRDHPCSLVLDMRECHDMSELLCESKTALHMMRP